MKRTPQVQMGEGALPPRIRKHLPAVKTTQPKVQMGEGALPPRIRKHLPLKK